MADNHLNKDEWIKLALATLRCRWADATQEYAEGLYKTYVEADAEEWANDPEGAAAEDMSYWDDE
jgi:hypothetical protein